MVSLSLQKFDGNKISFTIDHILNVAGDNFKKENSSRLETNNDKEQFDWLNCTRYRPPKLPRQRRKDCIPRRKLGRNPRIPFSTSQVALLEATFLRTPYLSSDEVKHLALYLKLTEVRVKIWFQNRRAREKRDRETKKSSESNKSSYNEIKFPNSTDKFLLNNSMFLKNVGCEKFEKNSFISPLDLRKKQIFYKKK